MGGHESVLSGEAALAVTFLVCWKTWALRAVILAYQTLFLNFVYQPTHPVILIPAADVERGMSITILLTVGLLLMRLRCLGDPDFEFPLLRPLGCKRFHRG